jgi:hypothetical protein
MLLVVYFHGPVFHPIEKLKFSPRPVNKKLELGSSARVYCKAQGTLPPSSNGLRCCTFVYGSVAQPFYTHGTLNIVKESWPHTNPILHIVGGKMVYGIDWLRHLLINRPQPKNVLFDVHNYPSLLLCHLFLNYSLLIIIMRGENFVSHLYGLGGTEVCRGTPVAHHCAKQFQVIAVKGRNTGFEYTAIRRTFIPSPET